MKRITLPYSINPPPEAVKTARLDNIALVPASLLPLKGTYQPIPNRLPKGSILCVPGSRQQQKIIAQVTQFFRSHGRQVITLPIEKLTKRRATPRTGAGAQNLKLAF